MKYYIIAGEASGDLHASLLMKGLKAKDPDAQFRFWGGEKMSAVGGEKVRDVRDTAVMGLTEVISKAGRLSRNLEFCKADIIKYAPDALVLVDYPGFNLRIARFAHEKGLKVFWYIAPKVWATREKRVEQLKKYVDHLMVIFPFEEEWFRSRGIDVLYEGNPLVDYIDQTLAAAPSREDFLKENGLEEKPIIALLPGSRLQEIKFLSPRFGEVVAKAAMGESPLKDFQFVVAGAPGIDHEVYQAWFPGIKVVSGKTYELLKHSAAAAVASGTASLEAAIIGTPQVVCYGMNPLSFRIAISMLKVKYVSLANLIQDKLIFKELLQEKCTPEAIAAELEKLVDDQACRTSMQAEYAAVRAKLGDPGSANRYAEHIINYFTR